MRFFLLAVLLAVPGPARACGLALALLIDVSGSVDPREFDTQVVGLAEALRDPVVSESLVRQRAALNLIQWTGASRQTVSIPWTPIRTFEDLDRFAQTVHDSTRKWRNFSTAIGEALTLAEREMAQMAGCKRRVIDVSGDGSSNEGADPAVLRDRLVAQGITINALVITGSERDLVAYFEREVIGGEGAFALASDGYRDYPERIRQKLLRETASALSEAPGIAPERDHTAQGVITNAMHPAAPRQKTAPIAARGP
ncbi:MAG: DUF1194 domain-containing protein [Pseudomonadota bacterium]